MTEKEQEVLRHAMEAQFRYKFYQDQVFPYLQSMGIRDVFQGFGNDEVGFIGMLHLWWVNEDNNIVYDNPKKWPVKIKGLWKSEWFDTPEEGMAIAQKIQDDKPYKEEKLIEIHQKNHEKIMEKQLKKQIQEKIEEEEMIPENILWN